MPTECYYDAGWCEELSYTDSPKPHYTPGKIPMTTVPVARNPRSREVNQEEAELDLNPGSVC